MDIKGLDHSDLMSRINETEVEERQPLDKVPKIWRDFDIRQGGDKRIEAKISIGKAIQVFRKFFKKEK